MKPKLAGMVTEAGMAMAGVAAGGFRAVAGGLALGAAIAASRPYYYGYGPYYAYDYGPDYYGGGPYYYGGGPYYYGGPRYYYYYRPYKHWTEF